MQTIQSCLAGCLKLYLQVLRPLARDVIIRTSFTHNQSILMTNFILMTVRFCTQHIGGTGNMKSSHLEQVDVYMNAVISIVGLASMIYGSVEFYGGYLVQLGPPRDEDFWEGGDVVLAIKQRGMTAATYIRGFQFALAVIFIGAGIQCALVYRHTRDALAALRVLFQVELVYQALRYNTANDTIGQKEKRNRETTANIAKIGNYGVYCSWALNSINNTYYSVFERPMRSTVIGRDLVSVWTMLALILIVLAGYLTASHLADAVWSVWHARTQACTAKAQPLEASGNSPPAGNGMSAAAGDSNNKGTPHLANDTEVSFQHIVEAVLRFLVCTLDVMSHLTTLSLIAVSLGGMIIAVAVAQFIFVALAYYAVTRKPIASIFWSYLTEGLHLAFDPVDDTHRKAWWVSVVWAILSASMGIVLGALQANMYLFTRQYHTDTTTIHSMQGTTAASNSYGSEHLSVERNFGIFVACMAAANLVVYLTVVFKHMWHFRHMHRNVQCFIAEVHMPSTSEA